MFNMKKIAIIITTAMDLEAAEVLVEVKGYFIGMAVKCNMAQL